MKSLTEFIYKQLLTVPDETDEILGDWLNLDYDDDEGLSIW